MLATETPGPAACPGCLIVEETVERAQSRATSADQVLQFHLPTVHCAACISTVERGLMTRADVTDVRVNLTRKRAIVHAQPGVDPASIVSALARLGYEAQPLDAATLGGVETDKVSRELLMRLGVSGFAMMNVMLLSVAVWSGATDSTLVMFHWISAAIALPTVAFAAQPFFINALSALKVRRLNMDVPISLAILLACGMSLYETALGGERAYFDAALSLTFFLLAGRFLDQRMRLVARSAATELAAREAPVALRVRDGKTESVRVRDLAVGDVVFVQPGGRIPVDGLVIEGESELDRAFLTGETEPVTVRPGNALSAGEINLTGPLSLRATAVGADTLLQRLANLVTLAEQAKSRYNSLADRAARIYAPTVHLLALAAFAFWIVADGDIRFALNVAVAVLIITCPCALGLAVPAVSTVASGKLFRNGLLIKHETALERLAEVDEVVFDKTGTLTTGRPTLANASDLAETSLSLAAALARTSSHPRSQAIVAAAAHLDLPAIGSVQETPGYGVSALWENRKVRLGRADWATGSADKGTVLAVEGQEPVLLEFEDTLRPGAVDLVASLAKLGLPVLLLSGDTEDNVAAIAREAGIIDWRSETLPDEKADHIRARTNMGRRVLMVGDGLNDTAALSLAHVSIAPASALEASRVASDIVLLAPELGRIADAIRLARSARRRILENFGMAAIYNVIAVPLAFVGLASPLAAAIAMSSSSILVSLNALRTR